MQKKRGKKIEYYKNKYNIRKATNVENTRTWNSSILTPCCSKCYLTFNASADCKKISEETNSFSKQITSNAETQTTNKITCDVATQTTQQDKRIPSGEGSKRTQKRKFLRDINLIKEAFDDPFLMNAFLNTETD